ncbi:type II toxin-antitoxin system Phd/YefM family antitoxin [Actinocorallia herbida]|uniref:type II toxin-antitoxin system Phd/YefM family antitoxin n=1 Tax=Actinocorallia herbida TaxID=58109 RepID=UPI001B885249|nr:type II toxin-antitoxin system Phd/YefM family antitoxin [Actinocorallia herbida]
MYVITYAVTRPNREPAVVISLREYESLKETAFLLGIPANARRLAASIESLPCPEGRVHASDVRERVPLEPGRGPGPRHRGSRRDHHSSRSARGRSRTPAPSGPPTTRAPSLASILRLRSTSQPICSLFGRVGPYPVVTRQ